MIPFAKQYNSARDVVDEVIKFEANPPTTEQAAAQAARQWISSLEIALSEMNSAYLDLGNTVVPKKYRPHQQATLSAWRSGIEANITVMLYLEKFVTTGRIDDSLIVTSNRLFGEEDRYQLEARRALQDAR